MCIRDRIRYERVVTKDGRDVTEEYVRGAEETLQIAREDVYKRQGRSGPVSGRICGT